MLDRGRALQLATRLHLRARLHLLGSHGGAVARAQVHSLEGIHPLAALGIVSTPHVGGLVMESRAGSERDAGYTMAQVVRLETVKQRIGAGLELVKTLGGLGVSSRRLMEARADTEGLE